MSKPTGRPTNEKKKCPMCDSSNRIAVYARYPWRRIGWLCLDCKTPEWDQLHEAN